MLHELWSVTGDMKKQQPLLSLNPDLHTQPPPPGISPETIGARITFCLDNSYFEFNNIFYKQNSGGSHKWLILRTEKIKLKVAVK